MQFSMIGYSNLLQQISTLMCIKTTRIYFTSSMTNKEYRSCCEKFRIYIQEINLNFSSINADFLYNIFIRIEIIKFE